MLPIFNLATRRAAAISASTLLTRPAQFFPSLLTHLSPPSALFPLASSTLCWPLRTLTSPSLRSASHSAEINGYDPSPPLRSSTSIGHNAPLRSSTSTSSPFPITPAPPPPSSSSSSPSSSPSPTSLDPASYPMDPALRQSLAKNFSITSFFPIQAECYLPITEGRDLIGRSKTGTGKTLAFVLPLLQRLRQQRMTPVARGMSVIVLEPTRELARQVTGEIEKLSRDVALATVYGGVGYGDQQAALRAGVDICVGTPGRLMDLLERGACTTRATQILVLDEADEMLARGFKKEVDALLSLLNKGRKAQVLLFSATLPEWVRSVSEEFQRDAVVVDKVTGEENVTPNRIDHFAMAAPRLMEERLRLVGRLAKEAGDGRVILFCNRKADADLICSHEFERELGLRARALHGDLSQNARDYLMADFKRGRFKMLVSQHSSHAYIGGEREGGGRLGEEEGCLRG